MIRDQRHPESPSEGTNTPASAPDELESLVIECLSRWDEQGPRALEQMCAEHPRHEAPLRRRLEVLGELGLLRSADQAFPESLGEFQLLSVLGEGGMGIVYRALQTSLQREVALKLIRPDQRLFDDARQRFLREVEAIARLQHPGIVPVYTVGEHQGVLYYAMELVQGCSLAQVVDQLRKRGREARTLGGRDLVETIRQLSPDPAGDRPRTEPPAFGRTWTECCLRIAAQLCEALEHAHGRGVLHRDVKPSNVMLTLDGRALLLDFGLASTGSDARITRTGAMLGSLAFMSPEQVRGESEQIEERTDVYGVGVVLYEMLTLASPFESSNFHSTREAILAGRPISVRARNSALPHDVEVVCHKAMDADGARRYARCADLARDLNNILQLRPIEARPPTMVRRLRRAAQRHPARAVAIVAGLVFSLGLFPTLYWQQHRTNSRIAEEQGITQAALLAETQAKAATEAALGRAQRGEAKAMLGLGAAREAVRRFLSDIGEFRATDIPLLHELRRETLEEALTFYDRLVEDFGPEDPSLAWERARIRFELAEVLYALELLVETEALLRQCREERATLWATTPVSALPATADREQDAVLIGGMLGASLLGLGREEEARKELRPLAEPLRVRFEQSPPEQRTDHLDRLAMVHHNLGQCALRAGDFEAARAEYERILEWCDAEAEDLRLLRRRASAEEVLAELCSRASSPPEARAHTQEAVRIRQRIVQLNPASALDRERLAKSLDDAGSVISRWYSSSLETCLPYYEEAEQILDALLRDYPGQRKYLQRRSTVLLRLGRAQERLGRVADARRATERAVEILEETRALHPEEPSWRVPLVFSYHSLARCCLHDGLAEEALAHLDEGLALAEELLLSAPDTDRPHLLQEIAEAKRTLSTSGVLGDAEEELAHAYDAFEIGIDFLLEHPERASLRGVAFRTFDSLAERLWRDGDASALLDVADTYRDADPWKWQSQITLARAYVRARALLSSEVASEGELRGDRDDERSHCLEQAARALRRASEHSAERVLALESDEELAEVLATPAVKELLAELSGR